MREQIFAAVIGRNEPEALCIVEPFDCTGCHENDLSKKRTSVTPMIELWFKSQPPCLATRSTPP
jgi:hypothetical protein